MSPDSIGTLPHGGLDNLRITTASPIQYRPGLMVNLDSVKSAERKCANFAKDIEDKERDLDRAKSILSEIKNIIQNSGPDSRVRLKNGVFKGESGLVRNVAFQRRYKQERKEAAKNLGVPGNSISAAKAKSILNGRVDSLEMHLQILSAYQEGQTIHEQLGVR